MHRSATVPLLVSIMTAAISTSCGNADSETAARVVIDTLPNGALHVVNPAPDPESEPSWTLEEELRIGSFDEAGPATFGQLRGLTVTEDGHIVVLEALAQELRVFGADGEHLATYGGKGEGPGELQGAWGLMRDGDDQIWVPDQQNARMSVYQPADGFRESFPFHVFSWGFIWRGAMTEDGRILKPSITIDPERRELLRIWDRRMDLVDSVPLPSRPEIEPENRPGSFYYEASGGVPRGFLSVPYYPRGESLLDPRGVFWSTEAGDPSYRIVQWAPEGDTTLVLELTRPPIAVTEAERDSAIESARESLMDTGVEGAARQDWSKIPEVKPAVRSMFLAEDGRLWVEATTDTLATYDVFDRDGRYVGTVETTLNIWPWVAPVVRGDRIWAVVTDEFDVPYVVRARITDGVETVADD